MLHLRNEPRHRRRGGRGPGRAAAPEPYFTPRRPIWHQENLPGVLGGFGPAAVTRLWSTPGQCIASLIRKGD
ncbi:MAG: hypothetical protein K0S78_5230 [Thermomicrobiales bacterium]|jgi:hypothetical protein|nr:hypothetical protein [Thermomicrobiales bacterium]